MSGWYSVPILSIPPASPLHREAPPKPSEDMQAQGRVQIDTRRRFPNPLAPLGLGGPSFQGFAELSRGCRRFGGATLSALLSRVGQPERVEGAGEAQDARR